MLSLSLIISTLNINLNASEEFMPKDKQYHALAGTGIYLGCLFLAGIAHNNNIPWINAKTCLIPVYVAAVGKEYYDYRSGGTAEFADAAVTVSIPSGGYIIYEF